MNNEALPLYPTDKMESAIEYLNVAIKKYEEGLLSQRTYDAFMEEVKRNLRWAVSDINYAYGMIDPMPVGEPMPEGNDVMAEGNAMKLNAGAEGGRRRVRSDRRASTRRHRRRHRSKRA